MKRLGVIAVLLLGGVLAVVAAVRSSSTDESPTAAPAATRDHALLNAVLSAPVEATRGTSTITGRVVSKGAPVAGVIVTATRAGAGEALDELTCGCDDQCGTKLLTCGCPEASQQLETLVLGRRGEVVPIARTSTRADGTFELGGLESGSVSLWADSPSLGTAHRATVEAGAREISLDFDSAVVVSGKVTVDGRQPAPGAWVTAVSAEHGRFFDGIAGPDGTFSFGPVPPSAYALVASAAGALPVHTHVGINGSDALALNLPTPRTIAGTVVSNGAPLAGVSVHLEGNHRKRDASTSASGAFTFEELRPGEYALTAERGDLRATASVVVPKAGNPAAVVLALESAAVVVGHVRDTKGQPISGASVWVGLEPDWSKTTSAEDGSYRLSTTAGPNRGVWVRHDGHARDSREVKLVPGEQVVDVVLQAESLLRGIVLDSVTRQPVANVRVWASVDDVSNLFGEGRSDDLGKWEVDGLPQGQYVLRTQDAQHTDLEVDVTAPSENLVLELDRGLKVDGLVVDESGAGIGAELSVSAKNGFSYRSAKAAANGTFTVQGLRPGSYKFEATAGERAGRAEVKLPLESDEHLRITVTQKFFIRGIVVDEAGQPVARAHIAAKLEGSKKHEWERAEEDGTFEIGTTAPGLYALSVTRGYELPDHEPVATAHTGDTNVRLTLRAARKLKGRVLNSQRKPISSFTVGIEEVESATGDFIVPLPSWMKTARIEANGYLPIEQTIDPKPAQVDLGEIILGAGRVVTLTVLSKPTQRPLLDAEIWAPEDWAGSRFGRAPIALTDSQGVATLKGLPDGPFAITVNHKTHRPTQLELAPSDTEKQVTLEQGATLSVSVVDARNRPVKCSVWAFPLGVRQPAPEAVTKPDGVASFEGMPPGDYMVFAGQEFVPSPGKAHHRVTLPESGEVKVKLTAVAGSASVIFELAAGPGAAMPSFVSLIPAELPTASIEALRYDVIDAAGDIAEQTGPLAFEATDVVPGSYTVQVVVQEGERFGSYYVPLRVSGNKKQSVVVPLPPPGSVSFRTRER